MGEPGRIRCDLSDADCISPYLPAEAERYLRLAAAALGRPHEAERYLYHAVASAPDRPEVYLACYRFYLRQNDLPLALEFADEGLRLAVRRVARIAEGRGSGWSGRSMPFGA